MYTISAHHNVTFKDQEISDFVESQKDQNNHETDTEGDNEPESDLIDFATEEGATTASDPSRRKRKRNEELDVVDTDDRVVFMRGDGVKVAGGSQTGQYALITDVGDGQSGLDINYFEERFGKYALNENTVDSREASELLRVDFNFDSRSRYTFDV